MSSEISSSTKEKPFQFPFETPESSTPSKKQRNNAKDSQFAADSNTKSFVPCKVCGDKASGYHYGVTSCEGCKKQIEYRCLRDGKCLVIRLNRNRCQFCRFKKCLAVGMSRDSVRYGRVPKRSRQQLSPPEPEPEPTQLALYDIILTISHAHHAHCAFTEEKTRGIVRKPITTSGVVAARADSEKIDLWQMLAVHVTPSIQRVVEFAKRVPSFLDLTQDDQLILIKLGFFECFCIHVSRLSHDSSLTFSDGSFLTKPQLQIIFDYDFVESLFTFFAELNSLALNDTEIGLFTAFCLLQSDRSGIFDTKTIDSNGQKLNESLKLQLNRNHSTDAIHDSLLKQRIPELRSLGAKHAHHLQWFRQQWTRLKLPPLFAEIFDIPKCGGEND